MNTNKQMVEASEYVELCCDTLDEYVELFQSLKEEHKDHTIISISFSLDYDDEPAIHLNYERPETDKEYNTRLRHERQADWQTEAHKKRIMEENNMSEEDYAAMKEQYEKFKTLFM